MHVKVAVYVKLPSNASSGAVNLVMLEIRFFLFLLGMINTDDCSGGG